MSTILIGLEQCPQVRGSIVKRNNGSHLGYVEANVAVALDRAHLEAPLRASLRSMLDS